MVLLISPVYIVLCHAKITSLPFTLDIVVPTNSQVTIPVCTPLFDYSLACVSHTIKTFSLPTEVADVVEAVNISTL